MISRNLSCNGCKSENSPVLLRPTGKDYLWGGTRLKEKYYKDIPMEPLAETWECSTHPDGPSIVNSGEFAGKGLDEVLKLHPEWLGSRYEGQSELPVLIKFIDAASDLSVQVHPDDEYALAHENQLGKTEMWYVLEADPGSSLIYGFTRDISREKLEQSVREGKLLKHLQLVPVHKNDVFFVKPGTVHAIGSGVIVAEIQENSNVTYRVFDYDRVDKNGQKRPLHLEKAMEVMNLKQADSPRQKLRLMRYQPGSASEVLCRCKYFQVNRVLVTASHRFVVESASFQVLLVLEGEMQIGGLSTRKGDCVFLPADCGEVEVLGRGQLLQVLC